MMTSLSERAKKTLLEAARRAIEAELSGLPTPLPSVSDAALLEPRGAFVTLHKKGALRGCIGIFESTKPLIEVVMDMAISAAFHDPRFPPLHPAELPEVDIEISALSPLRPISSPDEIQVGKHGIYITLGPYRGVLLPQVATEHGWDRDTFLDQTCWKAGLAPGCWKDPACRISIFTAEIFGEHPHRIMA